GGGLGMDGQGGVGAHRVSHEDQGRSMIVLDIMSRSSAGMASAASGARPGDARPREETGGGGRNRTGVHGFAARVRERHRKHWRGSPAIVSTMPLFSATRAYHVAAMHVRPRGNRFELKVQHKMLPKTFYASFATEAEAREYGARLEALLDRGILVDGIIAERSADPLLSGLIASYRSGALPPARDAILAVLADELAGVHLSAVTYRWCEAWVAQMKRERHFAPGTIRKRVSALSHALEDHHRRIEQAWANPLRLLPRGYASYSREDAAYLAE